MKLCCLIFGGGTSDEGVAGADPVTWYTWTIMFFFYENAMFNVRNRFFLCFFTYLFVSLPSILRIMMHLGW